MLVEQCARMYMIFGNDQDVRLLDHVREIKNNNNNKIIKKKKK